MFTVGRVTGKNNFVSGLIRCGETRPRRITPYMNVIVDKFATGWDRGAPSVQTARLTLRHRRPPPLHGGRDGVRAQVRLTGLPAS